MDAQLKNVVSRLENLASRFETILPGRGAGASGSTATSDASDSPVVRNYDDATSSNVSKFQQLSSAIGGDVAEMGKLVNDAFRIQREFIVTVSKYAKPSDADMNKGLQPMSESIQKIQNFREKNRPSKQFNHLSAVSESIPALGWIAVSPTPAPYIKECLDAGQFYTNRVLKDYKGKDQTHVDWVACWIETFTALHAYVKQYHTTGIVWNSKGVPYSATSSQSVASPGPPPPPPPPPPAPLPLSDASAHAIPADDGHAKLFASISKGGDITKGLRKVKPEEQTHKNAGLRLQATVPDKLVSSEPSQKVKAPTVKPPIMELQGKKWVVENFNNNQQLVIDNVQMNQSVYIYKCTKCTIQVKGKINSIVMDNCQKTAILFDNIVACMEFINCQSVKAQVTGSVPTVSVDKTDGFQMYMSPQSMNCEIITSKSSEMNVSYPQPNGDYVEVPLPEQYKTIWNGKKFVTTCAD
ncbi:Adenylyl cyclase-associated protein 2 [Nymphon striatum]|nr:Adenylyl cyclase-associated protein 2 [Nymphon striatum]